MEESKVKVEQGCRIEENKAREDQAWRIADEFVKYYYEAFDRWRYELSRFYHDGATLVYQGYGFSGKRSVVGILQNIPLTDHVILSIDPRPMTTGPGRPLSHIVVDVTGDVYTPRYPAASFQQQMIITAESGSWKILSDCYKFQSL